MRKILIIAVLVSAALLGSCVADEPRVEYNGELLSQEDIFALADQFTATETVEEETESEESEETREPADGVVYWTESGSVFHERLSCGHLSKKNEIISGSIEEAIAEGKARGCAFCTESQEPEEQEERNES